MEKRKIKIRKIVRNHKKYVSVRRLECGKYEVYFDFVKVPIVMNLSYLARMVNNKQIAVKNVIYA